MVDDSYYITPHETALAVVATSMKKARLRLDTLVVNSIVGGVVFSAGGMLAVMSQSQNPLIWENNPGIVHMFQGSLFALGLFYVVTMGADLFNSNILFFSVGLARGAINIFDLLISWSVSWLFNLASNLFVCYVICHLSGVTSDPNSLRGTVQVAMGKASFTFIQTFIKGIAGNFFVCLAIYLQLMVKPLHVKLIMIYLPIFTFVAMGFTHVVADMYMIPMGMINGADISVGKYIWKLLIPATLGNIVGGAAFGVIIPWYLHLVVVELDRKELKLPEYEARDEQPELNVDSRVVRVTPQEIAEDEDSGSSTSLEKHGDPVAYQPDMGLTTTATGRSSISSRFSRLRRTSTASSRLRSPAGVFPVRGMGAPLTRERTIVNPYETENQMPDIDDELAVDSLDDISVDSFADSDLSRRAEAPAAVGMGSRLGHALERAVTHIESGNRETTPVSKTFSKVLDHVATRSTPTETVLPKTNQDIQAVPSPEIAKPVPAKTKIMRSLAKSFSRTNNVEEIHRRLSDVGVTSRAAAAANSAAGIDDYDGIDLPRSNSPYYQRNKVRRSTSTTQKPSPAVIRPFHTSGHFDNDNFEEQSVHDF